MAEYTCPKCNRVFTSVKDMDAKYACEEHTKYCSLPRVHKILQVVLFPLGFVGLSAVLVGFALYFILAPVAYPFVYAMKLLVDSEVYTWEEMKDAVYGADRVKSFKSMDKVRR